MGFVSCDDLFDVENLVSTDDRECCCIRSKLLVVLGGHLNLTSAVGVPTLANQVQRVTDLECGRHLFDAFVDLSED
jgi:hypothetical protein